MRHRIVPALVVAAVATVSALLPVSTPVASAGTATTANVVIWYSDTGSPIISVFFKAKADFKKGEYAKSCALYASEAKTALSKPFPPDGQVAFHWGAALAFLMAGGSDCSAAIKHNSAPLLTNGVAYVNDGGDQLATFANEIQALLGA